MTLSSGNPELLDLSGEVCPMTFVRARLVLEEMEPGESLDLLVDFEPASRNVPRSAREWGQEVAFVRQEKPGQWRIRLIKRSS
jgi:tRNA 2-thiouridine synthesizing protein A